MLSRICPVGVRSFLSFGRQGRNFSIRRIDNQRRVKVGCTFGISVPPEVVVRAHLAGVERLVAFGSLEDLVFPFGQFAGGEGLFSGEVLRTLKGNDGGVAPYALQVGLA